MFGIRRTFGSGAIVGVAALALLVVASAPAASGHSTEARLFLSGAHARGQPPRTIETMKASVIPLKKSSAIAAPQLFDGKLRVILETSDPARARASVLAAGGRIERTAGGLVQALVDPGDVKALERRPSISRVRAPYTLIEHAVSGEEVAATLASAWHAKGFTGKGVKVAVIDGGFRGLADRQAAGDLPANIVTQDLCAGEFGTADDHGTAVAEIVHEMAPDAQLYLVCVGTEVDLAAAASYAKSQGVSVINQSMGWEGPYRDDGGGPVGAIVADARANGILWVNSAGNEGQTHWSGTYASNGSVHQWSPSGDVGNTFIWPDGAVICGFLKWDEWPVAVSDFDLYLGLSGSNVVVAVSEDEQGEGGGEQPFEGLCARQTSGADVAAFWAIRGYTVRSNPPLDLVSWSPPLEYQVAAGSITTPASSPAAFAVGALCWQSRGLEPYSSQGPTIDGRVKPDIVGHDSVSGATYGTSEGCPSGFAGTSASSPEVAGAAALVKQAYPKLGPDQIKDLLMRSARDLGAPGVDNVYGAGELQLPEPPDLVAPRAKALSGTGRRGRMLGLRSVVSDDSGEVTLVEQIKLGRKTVATIKRGGYVSAARPKTVATPWKVPVRASGSYQHCVRAIDRAGNASPSSCARLVLG
jgi:subtilisin family serine protease